MPNCMVYVRGEWTTGSADGEIGSLTAPKQLAYATGVVIDKRGSLATATALKVYDATIDPADWDSAFIESPDTNMTVVTRGAAETDTSVFVVKAGTILNLSSNLQATYAATVALRIVIAPTAIEQVWIYHTAVGASNYRFVCMT